jgi:hypothetical protein
MRRIGLFGYAGVWAWAIVATTAIRAQSTLKNSRGGKFFMISFYYEIFGRKFFAEFDDEIFFLYIKSSHQQKDASSMVNPQFMDARLSLNKKVIFRMRKLDKPYHPVKFNWA